jgi:molybdate transport system substrate-binding protein
MAAVAMRPAVLALAPDFHAATGHSIAAEFALNPAIGQRLGDGEPFDVVITNPDKIEDLIRLGRVQAGRCQQLGRVAMGVAARSGHPPVELGTPAAFVKAMLAARSVAYASQGTSGAYFLGLLERLGIATEMEERVVAVPGNDTATSVLRGLAELAVVPITSIIAAEPEVTLLGRFPAELQSHIEFSVGVSTAASDWKPARELSDLLLDPAVDGILTRAGVERSTTPR